jgi:hypothetical protein
MTFHINQFSKITNFKRLGTFETFMKFGEPYEYEKISGKVQEKQIMAWICLADDNIYGIEFTEIKPKIQ